jgi:hypothetical protein
MIVEPRDLLRAEAREVVGHELGVEQHVAAGDQSGDQMNQGHLRGVGAAREHALAEEGGAEGHAVQAADQLPLQPALDAVGVAHLEQLAVEAFDRSVDPGLVAAGPGLRAGGDHLGEGVVEADLEGISPDGPGQPMADMEAVERNDPAPLGVDQEDVLIVARVRHGEDPVGVAVEQILGVERVHVGASSRIRS